MKYTVDTKNIGQLFNSEVEVMSKKTANKLSHKIDVFIKAQIKPKPYWFPSKKLWQKLACKFLEIQQTLL